MNNSTTNSRIALWRQLLAPVVGIATLLLSTWLYAFFFSWIRVYVSERADGVGQQLLVTGGLLLVSFGGGFAGALMAPRWFLGAVQGALTLGGFWALLLYYGNSWQANRLLLAGSIFFFCPLIAYLALDIHRRRQLLRQRSPVFTFEHQADVPKEVN